MRWLRAKSSGIRAKMSSKSFAFGSELEVTDDDDDVVVVMMEGVEDEDDDDDVNGNNDELSIEIPAAAAAD